MSDYGIAGERQNNRRKPARKLAFVGQPEYFRCMYEKDLDRDFEVREFQLGWGKGLNHYLPLIKYDPDIAFFFRPECYPAELVQVLSGITVALSSEPIPKHIMGHGLTSADMQQRFQSLVGAKDRYDFFFHYDKTSLRFLMEQGFQVSGEFLFPVATGLYQPADVHKTWDWGFFGRDTPHREAYLGVAKRDYRGLHVVHGIFGEEFVRLMSACKIGLNIHCDANLSLEHRMHNTMACGAMVMSEALSHNEFLKPNVHYVEFSDQKEFFEKLEFYLEHDTERERIAVSGLELIQKELNAEGSFRRLIEYVTAPAKPSRMFSNYVAKRDRLGQHGPTELRFERINSILYSTRPRAVGWAHKLRQAIWRMAPPGTRRRDLYTNMTRPLKRMLGDEHAPLGRQLAQRLPWLESVGRGKPQSAGKQSLQRVLGDSAARLELPANAPSIMIVLPSLDISGGTMVLCEHANRLIRRGYNVLLVDNGMRGDGHPHLDWFPEQRATVITINDLWFDCHAGAAMATHWSTATTVIELPALRHLYFVQSDETRFNPPGSVESRLAALTYDMDFEFLAIARWIVNWLNKEFGKSANFVPNAVDESRFYPDKPLAPKGKKLRVLLEGAIAAPMKGMSDAFEVVKNLDCEVWCVSSNGVPQAGWRCDRFFHAVPQSAMRQIYSSCDVLLKMSRVEGFFLPPLEMMACGGTIVTGKVTGYDEYIVDGQNGLVVEQGDIAAARAGVQRLIDGKDLLKKLKSNGRDTAAAWRWDRSSDAFCRVLEEAQPGLFGYGRESSSNSSDIVPFDKSRSAEHAVRRIAG